jgi:formylglycine-generating enzyme
MKDSLDADGIPVEKDSLGRMITIPVNEEDNVNRRNYKKSDVINFLDGDQQSEVAYNFGISSLINDKARVYKGGSWEDRAYWLAPGVRRFMDQEQASRSIGFRCAMDRVGSPGGNNVKGGNNFKKR